MVPIVSFLSSLDEWMFSKFLILRNVLKRISNFVTGIVSFMLNSSAYFSITFNYLTFNYIKINNVKIFCLLQ